MTKKVGSAIQKATAQKTQVTPSKPNTVAGIINHYLDSEGLRKRFDELLGKRAPQFISSLVTIITGDAKLQQTTFENPMSVIGAALRAASYDLPIDPALGFAYVLPFENSVKQADKTYKKVFTGGFVIGYRGYQQLCLRTGVYARVPDAVDIREGELVSYDRLRGDIVIEWIGDEEERNKRPIIGYAGYYRLLSGAEKTIYMTKRAIDAHEIKHRKGDYQSKSWRNFWESMARKTVIRELARSGLMSIDYQNTADPKAIEIAERLITGNLDDEDLTPPAYEVDFESGEVAILDEQAETK